MLTLLKRAQRIEFAEMPKIDGSDVPAVLDEIEWRRISGAPSYGAFLVQAITGRQQEVAVDKLRELASNRGVSVRESVIGDRNSHTIPKGLLHWDVMGRNNTNLWYAERGVVEVAVVTTDMPNDPELQFRNGRVDFDAIGRQIDAGRALLERSRFDPPYVTAYREVVEPGGLVILDDTQPHVFQPLTPGRVSTSTHISARPSQN